MPWSKSRPRNKRYGSAHAKVRAEHIAGLKRAGSGQCAELVCIKQTRLITPGMDLHLCHDRRTGQVLGLGHRACNLREAARYARSVQSATTLRW